VGDSIVVIIDAWTWYGIPRKKLKPYLAERIIKFINSNPIHTAVLASYNCHREIYSDTVWYRNRLPLDNLIEYSPDNHNQHTIDIVLNYVNTNIFQIAMRNEKELSIYLSNHPKIKDIYILGEAWEICVKDRPLGYENVYKKFCQGTERRLLTSIDCVLTASGQQPELTKPWQPISNNVYQYRPDSKIA